MKKFLHFITQATCRKPLLFVAFCTLSLLFSCNKSDEDDARSPFIGNWIEIELWSDADRDDTFVQHEEPCDGDTEWVFNSDGAFRYKDDTPCDVPFPIDLAGTWESLENGTRLKGIFKGLEDEPMYLKIDVKSGSQMTMHTYWPDSPNLPADDKMVLRRK